jgi:hypothetical protein
MISLTPVLSSASARFSLLKSLLNAAFSNSVWRISPEFPFVVQEKLPQMKLQVQYRN